jgi:hypothetical protein
MSTSNRASKLTKTHRTLKKHYKPVPVVERPVLEHLLYAICLEHAQYEAADEAFAKLQQAYFDWNEVRVTTVAELTEVMGELPEASSAASRLRRALQTVFETYYMFDLEFLKKENLGKAVKQLQKLEGPTDFAVAYATQNGLGGHSIGVGTGALQALKVIGVVSDQEAQERRVPGLERAISKAKGVEFTSLLHQLGVDFAAAPYSSRIKGILLEIAPDAKDRLPKRTRKKGSEETESDEAKGKKRKMAAGKGAAVKKKAAKKKSSTTSAKKSTRKRPPATSSRKKSSTKRLAKKKPR